MSYELSAEHESFRRSVREFAEAEIAPHAAQTTQCSLRTFQRYSPGRWLYRPGPNTSIGSVTSPE